MTDQEINESIWEHLGWKRAPKFDFRSPLACCNTKVEMFLHADGVLRSREELPNYCQSLNATHELEGTLRKSPDTFEPGGIGYYLRLLDESCNEPIRATARERAEAFLRTVGKWKDK